jgi:UDP-N-acetyl-D-galactosamine dehydrogenase
MVRKIGVIGLGYVGLPLAVAFAGAFDSVTGFDINEQKTAELKTGLDRTGTVGKELLQKSSLLITSQLADLQDVDFFVVTVPTPVDEANRPDLRAVLSASELVGRMIKPGDIVVYESTVYPGVTEEICGPILDQVSGLQSGRDFFLGYAPERINPGDAAHSIDKITKVISGQNEATVNIIAAVYRGITSAGIYRAGSIRVAEAAKVIENTQRDLNIALMNELAVIFDKMNICTREVLEAAGTKWNFVPFRPGLVGGHCIGVDPYYLTFKAQELGYHPEVILAGRRINDSMGSFIGQKTVKQLIAAGKKIPDVKVGIFGMTFKENVPDIRNSRVADIVKELKGYGIVPLVADPLADSQVVQQHYGFSLTPAEKMPGLDALILAVPHDAYLHADIDWFLAKLQDSQGIIIDVKSMFQREIIPGNIRYWSL